MLGGTCTLLQVSLFLLTVLPAPVVPAAGHTGGEGAEVTTLLENKEKATKKKVLSI